MSQRYKVDLKSLYRYSSNKWNNALIDHGSIRVGTLHDYRDKEHKPGILDAEEGLKWIHHPIRDWNISNEPQDQKSMDARAIEMMGIFRGENGGLPEGRISNINMVRVFDEPNCFIHCTSFVLSKDVMAEFDGAESCVEIFDYNGFYHELTAAINDQIPVGIGDIGLLNMVRYQNRNEKFNGVDFGLTAALIKGEEFNRQFEVRAVWFPMQDEPIKPLFLEIPALAKYCKLL